MMSAMEEKISTAKRKITYGKLGLGLIEKFEPQPEVTIKLAPRLELNVGDLYAP